MREIIVTVNNQVGAVADVTSVLALAGVNIEEIDAEGITESGVISLCVDKHDEGLSALTAAGFSATSEDALVVRVADRPGALAEIASRLKEENINLRSLRIIDHIDQQCTVAIVAEDPSAARRVLEDCLF